VGALLLLGASASGEEGDYPHGGYEDDCTLCHGEAGEGPEVEITREFRRKQHPFPLRQAHDLKDCRLCHRSLDFTRADPSCVSCHQDTHRGENGIDCARCHVPRNFIDRSRMQRLHSETRFPLRGSHRALDCYACHPQAASGKLQWVNTPAECADCHLGTYRGADDPNHEAAGFPTECDLCHPVSTWEDGRFNHATTSEPCVTCHLDDYNSTRDPDHDAAGFPTDCEECHRPTSWDSGRFEDHDDWFFPIYRGEHAGRWDGCSECHRPLGTFENPSCLRCHPHSDEQQTRQDHEDEDGFQYESSACIGCHPNGRAD
jgi:hypothetical protein